MVARFEGKTHFWVEHLNKDCEALFAVNYFDTKDKNKFDIVKINQDGTHNVLNSYDEIELGIEDGCFAVKKNGLWGFIDGEGIEIIAPQYDNYCAFYSGLACVLKSDKWGFIDKQNNTVIPFNYSNCKEFYGGYAVATCPDGSKEVINTKGIVVYKTPKDVNVFNLGNNTILVESKVTTKFEMLKIEE